MSDSGMESELNDQQHAAIEKLIRGDAKNEVARVLGVAPNTISRWHKNAEFVAALNARRIEIRTGNAARLDALISKALGALESALESEDRQVQFKAATMVLKMTGVPGTVERELLTDPAEIEAQWKSDQRWKDMAAKMAKGA